MNTKSKPTKPDDPAQHKRFLEAARKAEADETEEGADRAFNRVAKPTDGRAFHARRAKSRDSK
jgi:hypothetical protein